MSTTVILYWEIWHFREKTQQKARIKRTKRGVQIDCFIQDVNNKSNNVLTNLLDSDLTSFTPLKHFKVVKQNTF